MKLAYPEWNFTVDISGEHIQQLVIEDSGMFGKTVSGLVQQTGGEEGGFVLSDNGRILNMEKEAEIILDPFSLEINSRKVINGLYSRCEELIKNEIDIMRISSIYTEIAGLFSEAEESLGYDLCWNEVPDIRALFKALDMRIDDKGCSFGEKILDHIDVMEEFCGIKCFFFVNLRNYISEDDLDDLSRSMMYRKNRVLFLERRAGISPEYEKTWIIDEDLCEIY